MKRTTIFRLLGCCIGILPLQAQQTAASGLRFGGLALNHDIMMAWDLSELARPQTFGTARATGMGGAFVSLGADMTSMSLNPAGLGMYRGNEFSLTPLVSISWASTPGTERWSENGRTRFALANVGVVLNVHQSATSALTSASIGFGMNRISDFNTRYSFSSRSSYDPAFGRVSSIADVYAGMLEQAGIYPAPLSGTNPNGKLTVPSDPFFWPAELGYRSAMIGVGSSTGPWRRDAIGENASIRRSLEVVNSGSINEFDISFGANLNNIVYVGASLGIQSVHKQSDYVYGEDYGYFDNAAGRAYDPSGAALPVQLEYSDLWQRTVVSGSGINFKLGVIVRPVAGLRIGDAFHTPTYYSLDRSYRAGMDYRLFAPDDSSVDQGRFETDTWYDEGPDSWDFVSPSRLMFGASYTFGRFAIVSVDYERDWYNGIRMKNTPSGIHFSKEDYKADFKDHFCATNALRAGVELRPLPLFALRAGGGYTSTMLRGDAEEFAYKFPQTTSSYYLTAGLGVNLSHSVTLDAAYQYLSERWSSYRLFYSYDSISGSFAECSDLYETSMKRHFVTLTLGVRF